MATKTFDERVITPDGTPLGGFVHVEMEPTGDYRVNFHMHSSAVLGDFDYALRAYVAAPGLPVFMFVHRGQVSGVDSSDHHEVGRHSAIAANWGSLESHGTLRVAKDWEWGGAIGAVVGIANEVSDLLEDALRVTVEAGAGAAGAAVGGIVGATQEAIGWIDSTLGPGGTLGVVGGVVLFAAAAVAGAGVGTSLILGTVSGAGIGAVTNAMIEYRPMNAAEKALAHKVYKTTVNTERVVLSNLAGLGGAAFTAPGVDGKIYVNLGRYYTDPLAGYPGGSYTAPGQMLIHELMHAWQIEHTDFLPGLMCHGIVNQADHHVFDDNVYDYGPPDQDWASFNLEQQAAIVDQWFAGNGHSSGFQPMDQANPYFGYIWRDVLQNRDPSPQPPRVTALSGGPGATSLYLVGLDEGHGGGRVWTKFFPATDKPDQWSPWFPLGDNVFTPGTPVTAISTGPGETSLYLMGLDGQVWTNFYPTATPGQWAGWSPLGPNTFPKNSSITALSGGPGATSLYLVGLDEGRGGGRVWTKFFPATDKPDQWSPWFPLGDNVFTPGTPVTAISTGPGETSLYLMGLDGQVWTNFYPTATPGQWAGWNPLGPNTFPKNSSITALSGGPGATSLYLVGLDEGHGGGRVWTKFFPATDKPDQWSPWFPLGDNVFTPGTPVTAISTGPGETSLYLMGLDGQVWTNFYPTATPGQWAGWNPLGPNTFPKNSSITALSGGPGATSLYLVGLDEGHGGGRVWTKFFPATDKPDQWSPWFPLGDNVFPHGT